MEDDADADAALTRLHDTNRNEQLMYFFNIYQAIKGVYL